MGERAYLCVCETKKDAAAYVNAICNILAQFYELTMISFSACLTASLRWLCVCKLTRLTVPRNCVFFIYFMAEVAPVFLIASSQP